MMFDAAGFQQYWAQSLRNEVASLGMYDMRMPDRNARTERVITKIPRAHQRRQHRIHRTFCFLLDRVEIKTGETAPHATLERRKQGGNVAHRKKIIVPLSISDHIELRALDTVIGQRDKARKRRQNARVPVRSMGDPKALRDIISAYSNSSGFMDKDLLLMSESRFNEKT